VPLQEQNSVSTAQDGATAGQTPVISFVMPIYNGLALTRECLHTLEQTVDLAPHEVILVDDASTDGTAEFLGTLTPPYQVIHNRQRLSYAACMNKGIALARGEFLGLLNNDLTFTPGWLEPMLRAFERLDNPGLVGNVQIDPRTRKYDHMGIVFGPDGMPLHFGKHFFFRPFTGYTRWKAVTAGCSFIRRSVFLKAGGFDEEFKNGGEDVDLCLRLGRAGLNHYVANDSVIYHAVSSSGLQHLSTAQNEARLMDRWREDILASLTRRDRQLFALNYLLRFATRPWRYNGPRLWHATLSLVSLGRVSHATARTER